MNPAPWTLIFFAAACLACALLALGRSIFIALEQSERKSEFARANQNRDELLEQKQILLRNLKDLEYERSMGKIADEDFETFNASYRQRLRQVINELDIGGVGAIK